MSTQQEIEEILEAILSSQIISVPISSALTFFIVTSTLHYLSQTSPGRESECPQPRGAALARRKLARGGACIAASVCSVMTVMEMVVVYQAAVLYRDDLAYLMRIPWPTALNPFLAGVVGVPAMIYFAERACRPLQFRRTAIATITTLVFIALICSFASTISLFTERDNRAKISEGFFWAFLISWALVSLALCCPLVNAWNKDRRHAQYTLLAPTRIRLALRLLLSTFLAPLLTTLACLATAVASSSPEYDVALGASSAFMALQKILARIVAVSYVFTLLDALPDPASLADVDARSYSLSGFKFSQSELEDTPPPRSPPAFSPRRSLLSESQLQSAPARTLAGCEALQAARKGSEYDRVPASAPSLGAGAPLSTPPPPSGGPRGSTPPPDPFGHCRHHHTSAPVVLAEDECSPQARLRTLPSTPCSCDAPGGLEGHFDSVERPLEWGRAARPPPHAETVGGTPSMTGA